MRSSKILLTFLILLAAVNFCYGQEKPQAVLVYKFGDLNCEMWMTQLDNFFFNIMNTPNLKGYVIISSPEKDFFKQQLKYENKVLNHAEFRKFDAGKIIFIHQKKEQIEFQLWNVPAGAEKPEFIAEPWSNDLSASTKAFIFGYDIDADLFCPPFSAGLYTEYLNANPGFRGNIVFISYTMREAREYGRYWLKILTKDFNIPRSRLSFFYRVRTNRHIVPDAEFWLVPPRKTRAAKVLQ